MIRRHLHSFRTVSASMVTNRLPSDSFSSTSRMILSHPQAGIEVCLLLKKSSWSNVLLACERITLSNDVQLVLVEVVVFWQVVPDFWYTISANAKCGHSPNRPGRQISRAGGLQLLRPLVGCAPRVCRYPTHADMGMVVFWASECLNENKNVKRSVVMRTNSSNQSSSGRRSADKVSTAPSMCCTNQKGKWKVVGDKVELLPGDYTIDDIEAMLKAIQGVDEGCVPRKCNAIK